MLPVVDQTNDYTLLKQLQPQKISQQLFQVLMYKPQ